jgi:hypothetical protein
LEDSQLAELTAIDAATKRYIRETPKLIDLCFQEAAMAALLKQAVREDYDGGRNVSENFFYGGLIGGPYAKGEDFDISEPQVEQQLQFNIKYQEVNITLTKEDIQVINKGQNAAFKLIESRTTNAYMTMGGNIDIAQFLNGTNANYTKNVNGLPEALNDNSTASWDGNTYGTYGGITRGGAVGSTLNSVPVNVNGTIEYTTLEENYGAASFGPNKEPTHLVTTYLGYSYIKEKFQTQQRFNDTQDPKIGINGMKFNDAVVLRDRYVPGTYISGTGDPIAVSFMKVMSKGALTAYPTVSAETLWMLNVRKPYINFYISDDPEYQLGFTGFKPAQGNTKVSGQVLLAYATTYAPRYNKQLYGITG